jgi:UDP-glucose 4-epimerase
MACPATYGKVFNLGSDQPVTISELAKAVIRLVNPSASTKHVSYENAFPPGFEDIRCRIPDLTHVRKTIDYRPRYGLDEIIRDVLAWKRGVPHEDHH